LHFSFLNVERPECQASRALPIYDTHHRTLRVADQNVRRKNETNFNFALQHEIPLLPPGAALVVPSLTIDCGFKSNGNANLRICRQGTHDKTVAMQLPRGFPSRGGPNPVLHLAYAI
jgi:hypothetical protein